MRRSIALSCAALLALAARAAAGDELLIDDPAHGFRITRPDDS